MKVILASVAAWVLFWGCGAAQTATDDGRGWQCAQVRDTEMCARTKSRCLENAAEFGADRANCSYVESAVCLRYSEPAEDLQGWLCGRTAGDCRKLKERNLGPSRVMLRDCQLRY